VPNPNAVLSTVVRLDDERRTVELEGKRRVRLDPEDRRSSGFTQILDALSKQRLPVYLELDPETEGIARLLIPLIGRVADVRPLEGGDLRVELEPSHAEHVLRSSSPDFSELKRQLDEMEGTEQPVILTEDDAHQIIDVRAYTLEAPLAPLPKRTSQPARRSWWSWLRRLLTGRRKREKEVVYK
jgi:hypothetical protein